MKNIKKIMELAYFEELKCVSGVKLHGEFDGDVRLAPFWAFQD